MERCVTRASERPGPSPALDAIMTGEFATSRDLLNHAYLPNTSEQGERPLRIDKLGVTGSSPVPPT
jgi:hypothetical protein